MPTKNPQLELPPSRRDEEFPDLRRSLQDRLRQIQQLFARVLGPRDSDLDMGGWRIIRLNDPLTGLDAANKRWIERHFQRKSSAVLQVAPVGAVAVDLPEGGVVTVPINSKFSFLEADLAILLPDFETGTVLLYIFRQDSIGGHTVTWPDNFFDTLQPDPSPNTASSFWFFKESDLRIYPCVPSQIGVLTE